MHNNVYNEFVLESATKSRTDWVATMPTKRFYIANGSGNNAGRLFQRNFNGNSGSCDDVIGRELRPRRAHGLDAGLVLAAAADADRLDLLGSERHHAQQHERVRVEEHRQHPDRFRRRVARRQLPGSVVRLADPTRGRRVDGVQVHRTGCARAGRLATTFNGLPVIGFSAITFENGDLPTAAA